MRKRKPRSTLLKILVIFILLITGTLLVFFHYTTEVTKNIDDIIYELPYEKGRSFRVVQGYGGLFSHRNIAALDFQMPPGTPIHAARDGVVYSFKDNSDEGGIFARFKGKANYIMIKHSDGSIGCYWHLQKNGVLVKNGRVAKGQKIALSGGTGQVLKPHLHFSVKRKLNYEMNSFVRTKFRTTKGILQLKRGASYSRPGN